MDANSRSGFVGICHVAEGSNDSLEGYITAKVSYTEILAPP